MAIKGNVIFVRRVRTANQHADGSGTRRKAVP
jgi:hypothetical protein